MAKDRYFFDHDYTARNDDKILELRSSFGPEGYGIFWMIVETMAENENGGASATLMGGLSLGYGVAKDRLLAIVAFCVQIDLFYEEEGFYFSDRMMEHKKMRKSLSDSGSKGAEVRWKNHKKNGHPIATPMHNTTDQNKTKEIITWEMEKQNFFSAGDWQFVVCRETGLTVDEFDILAKEFITQIQLAEDYKPLKELKKHFINWYNIKKRVKENGWNKQDKITAYQKDVNEKIKNFKHFTEPDDNHI